MAFIQGFKANDGILSGKMWDFHNINVDNLNWRQPPRSGTAVNVDIGSGYMGAANGSNINGVLFNLPNIDFSDERLLASFEILGTTYYKRELRIYISGTFSAFGPDTYTGDYTTRVVLRTYSDNTTFVDNQLASNYNIQYHRQDYAGVYAETTSCVFANITYSNHHYVIIGAAQSQSQSGEIKWLEIFRCWDYNEFFQTLGGEPEWEDYSAEFGPASVPDGYGQDGAPGTHDKHSDHVGIPTMPQFGFTSAGFLNHYRISSQGLSMLGEALFPEPQGVSLDIPGAIDKLTANMWNSKIIDYIIDCRIIPVQAPATNQVNITCGGKVLVHPSTGSAYSAYLVDADFVDVDCGVITTPLTEGNFIDFSVTRAKIFIPFYGFVDLAPEYWHGAKIGLYYRFNLMDGSFMAWLTSAPFRAELESASDMEIIGQYAGNACIHLPINSQSYSQIIGGMITTGAAIVGAAAGGAIGGAAGKTIAAGAVQTAISGAANIATGRPQLISNNSYNGSAALMSNRTPYLLIEFGEAQFSTKYTDECGLPLVVNKTIGNCSGMTVCDNAIINFACTDAEAKEILAALREGVIV